MRFEIYRSGGSGRWYWRLRARNGQIVADGAEGYCSKWNVKRAVRRVRSEMHGDYPFTRETEE